MFQKNKMKGWMNKKKAERIEIAYGLMWMKWWYFMLFFFIFCYVHNLIIMLPCNAKVLSKKYEKVNSKKYDVSTVANHKKISIFP